MPRPFPVEDHQDVVIGLCDDSQELDGIIPHAGVVSWMWMDLVVPTADS